MRVMPSPSTVLSQTDWNIQDHLLNLRIAESLRGGPETYAIHRCSTVAVRGRLRDAFGVVATKLGWRGMATSQEMMVMAGPGLFAIINGACKPDYAMLYFRIWTADIETVERANEAIVAAFGDQFITQPTFTVDWYIQRAHGELALVAIEELADDVLVEAAYPQIPGGVARFVERYLDAPEPILVLQGPPGTGKTRLIRKIIGAMAARSDGHTHVMYTSDTQTIESDQLYTKFLTTKADMFVIEDADYLLQPRSDGNRSVHRFLSVGDGIVSAVGRKMIFSTNLSNVGDIDEALLRPGRCFAHVPLRLLTPEEAGRLIDSLVGPEFDRAAQVGAQLTAQTKRAYSVADIYRAWRDCTAEASDPNATACMSEGEVPSERLICQGWLEPAAGAN